MKQGGLWGRLLRRGLALFMATVAVWLLASAAGTGAATGALEALAEDPELAANLLEAELGLRPVPSPGGLDPLGLLAVGQSAYLLGGQEAVAERLAAQPSPTPQPEPEPPVLPPVPSPEVQPTPAVTAAPGGIIPQTLTAAGEGYVCVDGVYISNRSHMAVDAAALASAAVEISLPAQGPQVLIMHSHACEAYTPDGADIYLPSDESRTLDAQYNVVRIGDEVQAVFEEMGLTILHDRTLYDYPSYSAAYTNARMGIENYLKEYPSIQIVLDIHRDALIGEDGTVYKTVTTVDGQQAAQVLLVLGTDDRGRHPDWEKNLALAVRIQKELDLLYPTLARPMALRTSHYNQFLTNGSLLVEVGCHGNTLQEAIRGARCFARAAGAVLVGLGK